MKKYNNTYIMILSEFIYGGMDGIITTVAIIGGVIGANISTKYALILGLANLLADGFSMGISRYNSLIDIEKANVSPFLSAIATFVSFVLIGSIPFIPFLFINIHYEDTLKLWLALSSIFAFLLIGIVKGYYTNNMIKTIFEVLVIGSIGVYISYSVSRYVRHQIN